MLVIFLSVPLIAGGSVALADFGKMVLLIIALAYFLAGVHLERPLIWIGVLMLSGYILLLFNPPYAWTILGLVIAAGLGATGALGAKNNGKEAGQS